MSQSFLKFDFKELFDFGNYISNPTNVAKLLTEALTDIANDFLKKVEKNTRDFGYRGQSKTDNGNLVRHWRIDNPVITVLPKNGGYEVVLSNKAQDEDGRYYASWVEKGHRKVVFGVDTGGWVYGRFFLKSTEVSFENGSIQTQLFEKQFRNFLERATANG